jgi:hypothetical protein
MKILLACLLIVHGLIVAAQSAGSLAHSAPLANPTWLRWWPTALGQSWLWAGLRAKGSVLETIDGVIWLVSGLALAAAGLGLLGVLIPPVWWRPLAFAGGVASLGMLLLYFHPLLGVGLTASAALLVCLLWVQAPWLKIAGL